jgi:hypothetical protein
MGTDDLNLIVGHFLGQPEVSDERMEVKIFEG